MFDFMHSVVTVYSSPGTLLIASHAEGSVHWQGFRSIFQLSTKWLRWSWHGPDASMAWKHAMDPQLLQQIRDNLHVWCPCPRHVACFGAIGIPPRFYWLKGIEQIWIDLRDDFIVFQLVNFICAYSAFPEWKITAASTVRTDLLLRVCLFWIRWVRHYVWLAEPGFVHNPEWIARFLTILAVTKRSKNLIAPTVTDYD